MNFFDSVRNAFVKPDWEKIFTPRARQVLALSRRAASEHGSKRVEVEHLLDGILRLNQGLAVVMLTNAGLAPSDLRANLERSGATGTLPIGFDKQPFAPAIKSCLLFAWREARALGNNYVGTEHILLGILRHGTGTTVKMLGSHGLTLKRARNLVKLAQEDEAKKAS